MGIKSIIVGCAQRTILTPLNNMVDEQLTDITTTIGSFIIRSIRGKFQRSISFDIGVNYQDNWMEEALYGILYKYNNIKGASKLALINKEGFLDGSGMYYILDDGVHNLKYRSYDILLVIQTKQAATSNRVKPIRNYTIITYNLDPLFVKYLEADMVQHRDAILRVKPDSPTIEVFTDTHDVDGTPYWDKTADIPKRKLSTIYIPYEQKKLLADTINTFYASKQRYDDMGIPWTLKILLYGPPSSGKSSIVKMIASEWNRTLFECSGGKNGRFIPECITDTKPSVTSPLFSISDIDKYPVLVNEPDVNIENGEAKDEVLAQKQIFNNMINALDGVTTEPDGRIIIMTTNHIGKFSKTFLRPGRIDLIMEIGYTTPEVFRKYYYDMYGKVLHKDIELKDDELTVGKMQFDVMFTKLTAEEFAAKYVK